MGKRIRSLSIQIGDNDVRITHHAIQRFRQRVENMPSSWVPLTIRQMLGESTAVMRRTKNDGRVYLAHERCVFVMTTEGLIVTVLSSHDGNRQFATSVKEIRKEKRAVPARVTRRSRFRRIDRDRHQRESRFNSHYYDHDHEHDE